MIYIELTEEEFINLLKLTHFGTQLTRVKEFREIEDLFYFVAADKASYEREFQNYGLRRVFLKND